MVRNALGEQAVSDLPALPDGWKYEPLSALVDPDRAICYGIVQPGSHEDGGVPIVRVNNIRDGVLSVDDAMRVSVDIESKYTRSRLRGGEVVLSLVGSLGETAIVPQALAGWNVARAVGVIPVTPKIGPRWIHLCLRSPLMQHHIRMWATTTVQATFNLGDLARLPIPLPPLTEQRAIAGVLGALDDKIEANRKTAHVLEGIARAVFTSWFVDFDPVHYNIRQREHAALGRAGRFISTGDEFTIRDANGNLVAPGGDAVYGPIAHLFPDRLVDSPLGEVPEGWRVGTVGEALTISREALDPGEYPTETFDHFSIPAFDAGLAPARDLGDTIKSQKFVVLDGCVLVSKLNPKTPRNWLPPAAGIRRQVASTEFLVCTPDAPRHYSREFVYCLASSAPLLAHLTTHASGTSNSHQRVRPQDFLDFEFVHPSAQALDAFTATARPIFGRIAAARDQSATLAALRDTLLPRLISGELRIADAEMIVSVGISSNGKELTR